MSKAFGQSWRSAAFGPLLTLALFFSLSSGLQAAGIAEIFLMLPDNECGGYTRAERQLMLESAFVAPGASGRSPAPDPEQPWVQILSTGLMVLNRPGYGNITYKTFDGPNFQLIATCRGRQRTSPIDSDCLFNLCLFRLDVTGLFRVELREYLPPISILDFITVDTLADPRAVKDIANRAPGYGQCLTCNISAHDLLGLDIVTATTVYAAPCDNFLPPFGLLPLTWNGQLFTKPYDRGAPKDNR